MDNNKITELLLKLSEDIAYIKGRLDTLDDLRLEQKTLGERIDKLESNSQEFSLTPKIES